MKYWCAANSNLTYFIELTTALECQKQLLMSSISNLGGRESLEIAVIHRNNSSTVNKTRLLAIKYRHSFKLEEKFEQI